MGSQLRNEDVADGLERIGDLLDVQHANVHRIRAYRTAAENIRSADRPLAEVARKEGRQGLLRLPGIGQRIASLIDEYFHTGRISLLDRLEGQVSPEDLFMTVPGIGERLAQRIHLDLGIETLEALEVAAHDGRLERVPRIGPRRVRGIRDSLSSVLGRSSQRHARWRRWIESGRTAPTGQVSAHAHPIPSAAEILAIDAEYRRGAETDSLHRITPRRFNPENRSWLPVLHKDRGGWSFSALFSNTARAHDLGMTRDWVVIYFERDGEEDQCTVVTECSGDLTGSRVVRGREAECARLYASRVSVPSRFAAG